MFLNERPDLGYVHIDTSTSTSSESGFSLRLVQASPVRVERSCHLYKDNSTRIYRQSPEKSNRENAFRKSSNIPLHRY